MRAHIVRLMFGKSMAGFTWLILCVVTMMTTAAPARAAVIKRCACWEGYKPEIIHGTLQCQGVQVEHSMSCDVLPPPRCVCTGHNGILKDRSGTWCTIYLQGDEVKRWRCENRKDWDAFFERLQAQQHLYDQKRPKPRP